MFFLREPKRRRQLRHSRKGLGGPEIVEKCQNSQDTYSKAPGACFFSEGAEAPQAAATQTQRAGNPETHNYCRLSQGNLDN